VPKLKSHILPCILSILRNENPQDNNIPSSDQRDYDPNSVLFKHDRIYHHNLFRINYTTYDVRRAQDVVNSGTSHHNIMVLASSSEENESMLADKFRYARVLGIYHANVVYVGPGMLDYRPRRVEFLWVRWYENVEMRSGWDARKLDQLRFPSAINGDSYGFIDPNDVLRSCHIVPVFAKGRLHADGKGLSRCAQDGSDWVRYYINR
jgi:hypothetical protein